MSNPFNFTNADVPQDMYVSEEVIDATVEVIDFKRVVAKDFTECFDVTTWIVKPERLAGKQNKTRFFNTPDVKDSSGAITQYGGRRKLATFAKACGFLQRGTTQKEEWASFTEKDIPGKKFVTNFKQQTNNPKFYQLDKMRPIWEEKTSSIDEVNVNDLFSEASESVEDLKGIKY